MKDRETSAHLPEGTLVAFTGGKDFGDVTAIWRSLDSIKLKYEDMVLLHGGGPGAEKIAASWAEKNGVHQVVCKPNWDRDGKAAPFRRNDVLLNFLPKGLLAFPGSGITNNLDRQGAQDRHPRPSRRRVATPFMVAPRHHTAEVGPLFVPAWLEHRSPWRGALRRRQPCELMLARGSLVLRTIASPPHRHGASRHCRTRALTRHAIAPENHPPLQTSVYPHTPKTATTDRRSSNAASLLYEPACAVVRLRTDRCLLRTPWIWQPRQPSFPAIRPCPETSAGCAP